ncbi:MAG: DUF1080 domain-containing protein [Planctomycetes bacterium]|nr:DUF1080 domain-containing protein [Planctomycetota bacterium]
MRCVAKTAAIAALLLVGMLPCGCSDDSGDSAKATQPVVKAALANRPADNRLCLVCHELLAEEEISHKHELEDLLCIDCHGPSRQHMEDEMLMTKADVLFGRTEVDPFCYGCHPAHREPAKVEAFREEWRGRDRPNGRAITSSSICTDCHGTHNLDRADAGQRTTSQPAEAQAAWFPLFNGKDLTGWQATGNAKWVVQDGALIGTQGDNNAPGDLLTEASYGDFQLAVTYKVEWPCNSGIWFRYQSAKQAYQADILEYTDPKCYTGTLYCTGKKFIAMNTDPSIEEKDGWNTISIRAEGRHLQVWLNGTQTADVQDDTSDAGKVGFQVHPGAEYGTMKIIVREVLLQPLGKSG